MQAFIWKFDQSMHGSLVVLGTSELMFSWDLCRTSDHLQYYLKLIKRRKKNSINCGLKTSLKHEPYFNGIEEHGFIHWSIAWVTYSKYWMVQSFADACVRMLGFCFMFGKRFLRFRGVLFSSSCIPLVTDLTPDIQPSRSCVFSELNLCAVPLHALDY